MGIEISQRLHVTSGELTRQKTLPDLPNATEHDPSILDRIGEQAQGSVPLVLGAAAAGGGIGAKLLGSVGTFGGVGKGVLGGAVGALGGAALLAGGLGIFGGDGEHDDAPELAATSEEASDHIGAPEDVKVMTYNLHGGMGGEGMYGSDDAKLDRLAAVIEAEDPDVLILQEVDDFAGRSSRKDVLAELDERLGPDSSVGASPSTTIYGRDQQNAVMTFNGFEVSDARNLVHQDPRGGGVGVRAEAFVHDMAEAGGKLIGQDVEIGQRFKARNTIDTIVTTPEGNDVRVLGGHYEWPSDGYEDAQAQQVGSVAEGVKAWDGPTIYGADFNTISKSDEGSAERQILGDAGLTDSFEGFATKESKAGIDRIYTSDHARVVDTRIIDEAGDASDHVPVVTELKLRPERSGGIVGPLGD